MLSYFILHFCVIAFTFLPGYLFYEAFFRSGNDTKEHIVSYSFLFGLLILGTTHFINFLFARDLALTNLFILGLITGGLILRLILAKIVPRNPFSPAFFAFVAFSTFCLFLITLLPSYYAAYKSDWSLYYPNIAPYLLERPISDYASGLKMEYLVRRTPMFSFVNAFFLTFSGNSYAYYQVCCSAVNSMIFWAVLIFAQSFFSKRSAFFILLCFALIPSVTYNIGIPTPKPAVIFCVLMCFLAYHRYHDGDKSWTDAGLLATAMVTAYMIHPSSLFYLVWIVLHQVYLLIRKSTPAPWKLVTACIAGGLLFVIPWYIWGFQALGADKILVPTYTISEVKLSVTEYITTRFSILFTTLFIPVTDPILDALKNPQGPLSEPEFLILWGNYWLRANVETFFGGYGFLASLFLIVSAWIYRKQHPEKSYYRYLLLAVLGAVACLGIHFLIDHKGLAIGIMGPVVVLLFIYLAARSAHLPVWAKCAMVLAMAVEFSHHRYLAYKVTGMISKLAAARGQKLFTFLYDNMQFSNSSAYYITGIIVCFGIYAWTLKLYADKN